MGWWVNAKKDLIQDSVDIVHQDIENLDG